MLEHRECGSVKLSGLSAERGVFPRLHLQFGVTAFEREADHDKAPHLKGYDLRNFRGELRLQIHGDAFAPLEISQRPSRIYSLHNPSTDQYLSMTASIAPWALERVEDWRKGKEPTFHIQLWMTADSKEYGQLEVYCEPFPVVVPQTVWVEALRGLNYGDFHIVEISHGEVDHELFEKALEFVQRAQKALSEGRFEECVTACRGAYEQMIQKVKGKKATGTPLSRFLGEVSEDRAEGYAKMWTGLKDAMQEGPHDTKGYRRSEALFCLQTVIHSLSLIGDISRTSNA